MNSDHDCNASSSLTDQAISPAHPWDLTLHLHPNSVPRTWLPDTWARPRHTGTFQHTARSERKNERACWLKFSHVQTAGSPRHVGSFLTRAQALHSLLLREREWKGRGTEENERHCSRSFSGCPSCLTNNELEEIRTTKDQNSH